MNKRKVNSRTDYTRIADNPAVITQKPSPPKNGSRALAPCVERFFGPALSFVTFLFAAEKKSKLATGLLALG